MNNALSVFSGMKAQCSSSIFTQVYCTTYLTLQSVPCSLVPWWLLFISVALDSETEQLKFSINTMRHLFLSISCNRSFHSQSETSLMYCFMNIFSLSGFVLRNLGRKVVQFNYFF